MRHIVHTLWVAAATVAAAVPALLADPAAQHLITNHPWLDAYFPLAAGVIYAISKAVRKGAGAGAAS